MESEGINVCDWCLDVQAKEKIERHKRKVEMQKMECGKGKEVATRSASTSAMKQPASVIMEKPRKGNPKPTLKLQVKFGGSKQNQPPSNLTQACKLSSESCRNLPRAPRQSSSTKGGLGRRYKLLSEVICWPNSQFFAIRHFSLVFYDWPEHKKIISLCETIGMEIV